jgi:hypothetical protein
VLIIKEITVIKGILLAGVKDILEGKYDLLPSPELCKRVGVVPPSLPPMFYLY